MRDFNLQQAEQGERVISKNGLGFTFMETDYSSEYPVIGQLQGFIGKSSFTINGAYLANNPSQYDLKMADAEPAKVIPNEPKQLVASVNKDVIEIIEKSGTIHKYPIGSYINITIADKYIVVAIENGSISVNNFTNGKLTKETIIKF